MRQLDQLDPRDVDQLVIRARRTLASHLLEMEMSATPADFLAAIDTTIGTLRELARAQPAQRHKIEALIARYASTR